MKNLLNSIKAFLINKAWPWIKTNCIQIINFLVIFITYSMVYGKTGLSVVELILGVWLFVLLAYYIFWKLLKVEKMFKSKK